MGVSPRISSYHHYLSLSLSLNPTVTMFFLPRLPLILAIIFLGLFCLPHTINCQDTSCTGFVPDTKPCTTDPTKLLDETCYHSTGIPCVMKCEKDGTGYKAVFRDE